MKKVLIVSLKAGAGHIKAAEAVEQAIKQKSNKASKQRNNKTIKQEIIVKNVDLLEYSTILSKKFYTQFYVDVVKYAPKFYDWLYHNIPSSSTDFRLLFDRINANEFKKFIFDFDPDVTVCTHFVAANIINFWREKYGLRTKTLLTVTDYESHSLWIDKDVDIYSVATDSVKKELTKAGIKKDRIFVTGIPIDKKFSKKYDGEKIRKKLEIDKGFTTAIFSGGFGMGPLEGVLRNIQYSIPNIQILVVAGKNIELKEKLEKIAGDNRNIKIFGFVDNIEELMAVSDIIITKPGGLTVSESLAMGNPLIISNPIPGQEEANSKFLLKNKAALRSDDPKGIAKLVKKVMKDKVLLKKLKTNALKIATPNAADDVAKIVEGLLK
ncbi:MAG TPA: glycosyltransferase [Patescibacteria group bacterium]|nr:glycosyltransferase [Patescibacteria group bacterium]